MKIAVLTAPRTFDVIEEPVPAIAADEVLVRVAVCAVCTSDLHPWDEGPGEPRRLGHEVSGVVERVGTDVNALRPGDPVAVWATGHGYAEFVAVKAVHCLPAPGVPLAQAAQAEPLACAVNAVELARVGLGDDVVIVGAGFMGSLVQRLVALRGPRRVIVADTRPDVLARAAALGASRVVDVTAESLSDAVESLTGGKGADVSFEVTGAQAALTAIGEVTRMSGKLVIVGFHQGRPREIPLGYWNWMAFQMLNAHFRDEARIMHGMRTGMRLLCSGRLTLDDVITHQCPLARTGDAFLASHDKPEGFIKSAVIVDERLAATDSPGMPATHGRTDDASS